MLSSLCGSAAHILVNILACERSRVCLYIPCHDEKEQGKGQKAQGVVIVLAFVGFLGHVVFIEFVGSGCVQYNTDVVCCVPVLCAVVGILKSIEDDVSSIEGWKEGVSLCCCVEKGSTDCVYSFNYACVNIALEEGSYDYCSVNALKNVTPNCMRKNVFVIMNMSEVDRYG